MRKLLLGSLLLLALTACALEPKLDQTRRDAIRSAAVVSIIGDDVHLVRALFSALHSDDRTQKLDWGSDAYAQEVLAGVLASKNIRPIPVQYDAAKLAASAYKMAPFEPYVDPQRIELELRDIASRSSADVIILVASGRPNGGTIDYQGAGIYTEGTLWNKTLPVAPYLALSLFIIDAKTQQVVASVTRASKGTMYNLNPALGLGASTPPAPFFAGFAFPMNDEQMKFLGEKLQEMLPVMLLDLSQRVGM